MLVTNQEIEDRTLQAMVCLSDSVYLYEMRKLYALQQPVAFKSPVKILLLMHGLNSWRNLQGVKNTLTSKQLLAIMDNLAVAGQDCACSRVSMLGAVPKDSISLLKAGIATEDYQFITTESGENLI